MHLKTLEIQGFKSFPERTIIEFHQGVTAIIGPNGSGKSNVTDAIRWVLGEQSVRTLRGSRMEDIIFTGTQSRRAMSYAEVSMVIDNHDGKLPIDYSEVSVTRRLYRSGESEYYLNKTLCRLKDITTLFMDTGLGRDGYSIVGQGRVDDILSNRSEDRRKIFEEASGIVKFKTRKEEAERKLENTQQNLLRINDLISELASRLDPLAEQATTARKYLNLRDRLKNLEIALLLENIDQHELKKQEQDEEKAQVQADLNGESERLSSLRDRNTRLNEESLRLETELEASRSRFLTISQSVSEENSKILRDTDRIAQIRQQISESEMEQADLERQMASLEAELADKQKRADRMRAQSVQYQSRLAQAESEMDQVLQTLDQKDKQIESHKVELEQLQEKLYDQRGLAQQTRGQVGLIESRQKSLRLELSSLVSDTDRSRILLEEAETERKNVLRQIEVLAVQSGKTRNALAEEQQRIAGLNQKIAADQQALNNGQYRLKTLQDLERNREGYSEPVRRIMQEAARQGVPQAVAFGDGIRGTLADLIRVEQQYELAIEIALGPALQNIVTRDEATASRLIGWLKEHRHGRATFLPISTIRGRQMDADTLRMVRQEKGFVAIASDLIRADADLSPILSSLLGRVIVVTAIDEAVAIARRIGYSCRIVTLEGDVINPGGSMTGGFNRQTSSGVLGRTREIETLTSQLSLLEAGIGEGRTALQNLEDKAADLARQLVRLDQDTTAVEHARIRSESGLKALEADLSRIQSRKSMLDVDVSQLEAQKEKMTHEADAMDRAMGEMEKRIAMLRDLISQAESSSREDRDKRDELRDNVSNLRVSLHSIEESLQAALEVTARIELERKSGSDRRQRRLEDRSRLEAEIERLGRDIELIRAELEQLQANGQAESDRGASLTAGKERIDAQRASFFDELESSSARISALQSEIGRIDARMSKTETLLDEAKNRLWEEYELTADQADAYRRPIDNRTEATREVTGLKNELRGLGPVNVAAIEEYDQVNERCTFLTTQRDDIEAAARDLDGVIAEITTAMKRQFLDHFRRINDNFQIVFTELFGGGTAELNLEDDADILNCGIEIKAQPPGKKLQNMMLLSGGERCLTAIALLFAILKLRPTPFCVLDEVEAALDDANVYRFTEYVRRYADDAQFILVTHRKGTMEAADRLYGVTMQEKGISRILSMQLGD